MTHRTEKKGNNGLPPGSATVLLHSPGPQLPFHRDRVGPAMELGDPPTWKAPGTHHLWPFAPFSPHRPASAPPTWTGCQVIAPHGHGMQIFKKRKKRAPEQPGSSQESLGKTEQVAAQRPAPSTCSLAPRQALPVEQVLLPALSRVGPDLGQAREAGAWGGGWSDGLLCAGSRKRWREAERAHEGSSSLPRGAPLEWLKPS